MTFSELLVENEEPVKVKAEKKEKAERSPKLTDPSDIIRDFGIKIKLVLPTNFGTEYVLAKKYEPEILEKLIRKLSPRKVKMKGTSLFVM